MTFRAKVTAAPRSLVLSLLWKIAAIWVMFRALRTSLTFARFGTGNNLDYPIQILSTLRVLHGERPFRDFQTVYGPLGYYIEALFFRPLHALDPVIAANYFSMAAVLAIYLVLCIYFSRRDAPRPLLLLGGAVLLAEASKFLAEKAWYSLPMLLPSFLALVAIQFAVPSSTRSPRRAMFWQILTGFLLATQMFVRFNFTVYPAFAILLVGAAAYFFGDKQVTWAAARALASGLVFLCLFSVVFAAMGILIPFLTEMRTYIVRFGATRRVGWEATDHALALWTAVALVFTLLRIIPRLRRRQFDFFLAPYITLIGFFTYTFLRFDQVHLLPFVTFALLILCEPSPGEAYTAADPRPWYKNVFGLPELQILVLFLFLNVVRPIGFVTAAENRLIVFKPKPAANLQLASSVPVTMMHSEVVTTQEAAMLQRLDSLRQPGDEVYWMSAPQSCEHFDDICADMGLYLAEGTLPREPVWYFDTVSTPYPDVQRRIVDGLEAHQTPWIGLQDVYTTSRQGKPVPGSTLLMTYFLSHYSPVFTTEIPALNRRYTIYRRNS